MSKPSKIGRPKLPDNKARKVYPLRISQDEKELFTLAATAQGQDLAEWMRKVLTERAVGLFSRK